MPILNYTTQISVSRTAGEIQETLAKAGARRVMIEFGNDHIPEAISFQIDYAGNTISYRLPSQWNGVHKALMESDCERKYKTADQARRVAWRILKDWTEAQLAMIQSGEAELTEVFLPYSLNSKGQTLFEVWKNETLALGSGDVVEGEIR